MQDYSNRYHALKRLASVLQGRVQNRGGNVQQRAIYEAIKSRAHELAFDEVIHDHPVALLPGSSRKTHKVDIWIQKGQYITAINVKSAGTNNTESADGIIAEYKHYLSSIESLYPQHTVSYEILKLDWAKNCDKSNYRKFQLLAETVPTHDTKSWLQAHGISMEEIEAYKHQQVVEDAELHLESFISVEKLYEAYH